MTFINSRTGNTLDDDSYSLVVKLQILLIGNFGTHWYLNLKWIVVIRALRMAKGFQVRRFFRFKRQLQLIIMTISVNATSLCGIFKSFQILERILKANILQHLKKLPF